MAERPTHIISYSPPAAFRYDGRPLIACIRFRSTARQTRFCSSSTETLFNVIGSRAHGHVEAVRLAMTKLRMGPLLDAKPSRERDLVLVMLAARILSPRTKLATTRWWHTTTLAEDFGVADASETELYAAMDWLLERQGAI